MKNCYWNDNILGWETLIDAMLQYRAYRKENYYKGIYDEQSSCFVYELDYEMVLNILIDDIYKHTGYNVKFKTHLAVTEDKTIYDFKEDITVLCNNRTAMKKYMKKKNINKNSIRADESKSVKNNKVIQSFHKLLSLIVSNKIFNIGSIRSIEFEVHCDFNDNCTFYALIPFQHISKHIRESIKKEMLTGKRRTFQDLYIKPCEVRIRERYNPYFTDIAQFLFKERFKKSIKMYIVFMYPSYKDYNIDICTTSVQDDEELMELITNLFKMETIYDKILPDIFLKEVMNRKDIHFWNDDKGFAIVVRDAENFLNVYENYLTQIEIKAWFEGYKR